MLLFSGFILILLSLYLLKCAAQPASVRLHTYFLSFPAFLWKSSHGDEGIRWRCEGCSGVSPASEPSRHNSSLSPRHPVHVRERHEVPYYSAEMFTCFFPLDVCPSVCFIPSVPAFRSPGEGELLYKYCPSFFFPSFFFPQRENLLVLNHCCFLSFHPHVIMCESDIF